LGLINILDEFLLEYPEMDKDLLSDYLDFISKAEEPIYYNEKHHILPKSLFKEYKDGNRNPWNMIKLSASDHFIAHYKLTKMFPDSIPIQKAFILMWNGNSWNRKFSDEFLSMYAEAYSVARKKFSEDMSKRLQGNTLRRGKKFSPEILKKMRDNYRPRSPEGEARRLESLKNKRPMSSETRANLSRLRKGKKLSEESRIKRNESRKRNKLIRLLIAKLKELGLVSYELMTIDRNDKFSVKEHVEVTL
jgi:hypothetical protein